MMIIIKGGDGVFFYKFPFPYNLELFKSVFFSSILQKAVEDKKCCCVFFCLFVCLKLYQKRNESVVIKIGF